MPQIEKPDDLQSIANLIRFFCVYVTSACYDLKSLNLAKTLSFTDKSLGNAGLSVKCVLITDKSAKNGTLSVNLNEILAESLSSTAFRSAGQNQSQIDRLRSVFHLIQARNGTFSQPLFVWKMQGRVMLWRFYKITGKSKKRQFACNEGI